MYLVFEINVVHIFKIAEAFFHVSNVDIFYRQAAFNVGDDNKRQRVGRARAGRGD